MQEKQALTLMRRILRAKTDEIIKREPVKEEEGEAGEDKLLEARGVLLLDVYNYYCKVMTKAKRMPRRSLLFLTPSAG